MTKQRLVIFSITALLFSLALGINRKAISVSAAQPPPAQTDAPTLTINLPPNGLLEPNKIYFGGVTCDFGDPNSTALANCNGNSYQFSKAKVINDDSNGAESRDDRYVITISGFPKGDGIAYKTPTTALAVVGDKLQKAISAQAFAPPPATMFCAIIKSKCTPAALPYGFQVTFKGTNISGATVNNYVSYLRTKSLTFSYLGNDDCVQVSNGAFTQLCLKTKATLTTPESASPINLFLIQSLLVDQSGSVQFEGNVAGGGSLTGFGFTDEKAISVGGSVAANGNTALNGYITSGNKLSWAGISGSLTDLFNKRVTGTTFEPTTYGGSTWNLNSSSNDPANGITSSFSSPPEGKLWNVNHSLTFNSSVNFTGSGTIAVSGDVTINGDVTCSNGQIGIIASGKITFNGAVRCGAYSALGGDIVFNHDITGSDDWNGIFVAKNDIRLPHVSTGTLVIHYNSTFANDPTVLFKELLGIVFSTNS